MSHSKLESLPNEILLDTLENYINAVDILVNFIGQLNSRFDAISAQCQQLQFDFIHCRLDSFRHCLGHLPLYLDKVTGLALSDRGTPGQIHAFLELFPSFAPFRRLRSLYFHCICTAFNFNQIQNAILSLSETNVEILSINIINGAILPAWRTIVSTIFRLTTLQRLSLAFPRHHICCNFPLTAPLNIEYLTIAGLQCDWHVLQSIFRYIPRLKYFNVEVNDHSSHVRRQFLGTEGPHTLFTPMFTLRTLILYLAFDATMFDILMQCLTCTPSLQRLDVDGPIALFQARSWQMLIERSLPQLTYFTLKTSTSRLKHQQDVHFHRVLGSFQTSFWMAKKYFSIIVTEHEPESHQEDIIDIVRNRNERVLRNGIDHRPVLQWWTAPKLALNDHMYSLNNITRLCLSSIISLPPCQNYFDNVKFLAVYHLTTSLVTWITTYINCSRITELSIALSDKQPAVINSLMDCAKNIQSLQIDFELLFPDHDVSIQRNNHLKCLDLSNMPHTLGERDIITIARIFPCIEHLVINTVDLCNILLLKDYLPNLCSLCFRVVERYFNRLKDFEQSVDDYQAAHRIPFIFQCEQNWILIWIDQAAFEKSFWQTFTRKSPQLSANKSMTTQPSIQKFRLSFFK